MGQFPEDEENGHFVSFLDAPASLREAVHSQKVTKLWTLSVPPLDPLPASTDTQRGVFGKAQKDD